MAWYRLTVQHEHERDTARIRVSGALDIAGAYDFEDALRRVERGRPQRLILDLGALDFLDSAGLARILALRVRCRRAHRELELVDTPPAVRRLLGLAGVADDLSR
jgi:anti-sigma B factor antagonist